MPRITPGFVRNMIRRSLSEIVDSAPAKKDIAEIWRFFKSECAYCGKVLERGKKEGHIDHLISASSGGPNHLSNRVLACSTCNEKEKLDTPWDLFLERKIKDARFRRQRMKKIREWQRLTGEDVSARSAQLNALVEKACDEVLGLYSRKVEEIRSRRRDELKKKYSKAAPTPTSNGKGKPREKKQTIRATLYALFEKKGMDKVTLEEATKVALAVKPDSKFNKWHLYFHRKNYRRGILDAEE